MQQPPPIPPTQPYPTQPLGYGQPYDPPFFSLSISLLIWIGGAGLLAFFCVGVPRFEQVFKDFKTELPGVTKALLGISRWVMHDFGWSFLLPVIAGLPFGICAILQASAVSEDAHKSRKRWTRLAIITMLLIIVLLITLALIMPFLSMLESVSGGSSKR